MRAGPVKNLAIVLVICGGIYFIGQGQGWFRSGESEAASTYKAFMDHWIVRDYVRAGDYVVDNAADVLEAANDKTTMNFMGGPVDTPLADKGIVEASRIKVVSESGSGDKIDLQVIYSASISWAGATANPMSAGSWKQWEQKATLVLKSDGWKVSRFSSN
jgi:hypothetical protein